MTDPNHAQRVRWVELGHDWVAHMDVMERHRESCGLLAMDRAGLRSGDQVVDVGCGPGRTTMELARRVGPAGGVVGLDISSSMLAEARRAAQASGLTNLDFVEADAQTYDFEPGSVDGIFSRFGVMFFADPDAAFARFHAALKPSGRLSFVCWAAAHDNEWTWIQRQVLEQYVPPDPTVDGAADPNQFRDDTRLREILVGAGFEAVDIELRRWMDVVAVAPSLDEAVADTLATGVLRRAINADPDLAAVLAPDLRAALDPIWSPDGIEMAAAVWLAVGHRTAATVDGRPAQPRGPLLELPI